VLLAATQTDAEAVGLPDVAEVIDPGAPMLGLFLERASTAFRETFQAADMVIAKGETHFETLSAANREIFFVLQARCESVAARLEMAPGSAALVHQAGRPGSAVLEAAAGWGKSQSKKE
jgi:damage-control phosphatase, subfamily I